MRNWPPWLETCSTLTVRLAVSWACASAGNRTKASSASKALMDSSLVSSAELRFEFFAGLDQALDGVPRLHQLSALLRRQFQLDDALHAVRSDHRRHADIETLEAIGAVHIGRHRQHALLVLEIALRHLDGRGGRRIEGRAGLEERDDLGAAVAGALHDLVEPLLRAPSHLDQLGQRDAGDGREAWHRHH